MREYGMNMNVEFAEKL